MTYKTFKVRLTNREIIDVEIKGEFNFIGERFIIHNLIWFDNEIRKGYFVVSHYRTGGRITVPNQTFRTIKKAIAGTLEYLQGHEDGLRAAIKHSIKKYGVLNK